MSALRSEKIPNFWIGKQFGVIFSNRIRVSKKGRRTAPIWRNIDAYAFKAINDKLNILLSTFKDHKSSFVKYIFTLIASKLKMVCSLLDTYIQAKHCNVFLGRIIILYIQILKYTSISCNSIVVGRKTTPTIRSTLGKLKFVHIIIRTEHEFANFKLAHQLQFSYLVVFDPLMKVSFCFTRN